MQEHFYESRLLTKDQLKSLTRRNNQPAFLRFTLMVLAFIGFATAAFLSWGNPSPIWLVLSLIGFGIAGCSTFACIHEAGHQTAFESKTLNNIAGFIVSP